MHYLDAAALVRLSAFKVRLRGLAEGGGLGSHRSLLKGYAQEFSHHRPYAPGDEIKILDWKLYARQDRFYVRQYHEETVLSAHILVDVSGSMAFEGEKGPKWILACRLAMALAYLVIVEGDAAGMTLFADEPLETIPPRSAFSHLEIMDRALKEASPRGKTNFGPVLERASSRMRRRSLAILISDFLGDPREILGSLKAFKARKHEVMAIQVLDPRERDFDYEGPCEFLSLEGGPPLSCDASDLTELYRSEFSKLLRLYEAGFNQASIDYSCVYTDMPWDLALGRLLGRRVS